MPVLAVIQNYFGWRGLFIISGIIGILWAVIWYVFYRDPKDHPTISEQELALLTAEPAKNESPIKDNKITFDAANLKLAFSHRKLWGIYIGQFCLGGTLMFFLTWFPTYLVEYRGLDFIKSGFLASVPFLAAFFGVLVSGFASDFLVRKGVSKEVARKAPIILGLMLTMSIVGANYTDDTFWIITFLSIAFFGNGLSSMQMPAIRIFSYSFTI